MLPEIYILDLRRRFQEMERNLSNVFRACLIPLIKLPTSTDVNDALYSYALSRKFLNDASRVFENRFFRSLTQQDLHIIYHEVLKSTFAETQQTILQRFSRRESESFSPEINRAINLLLPKIILLVYSLTRSKRSFPRIAIINQQIVAIVLYELAKSSLFIDCTADIYALIEESLRGIFLDFDELLDTTVFLGRRSELEQTWSFFDDVRIQLREEYLSKKISEDPLLEEDSLLPAWPETIDYSLANLQPLEIKQAFANALQEYISDPQFFIQFDIDVEMQFKTRFEKKFGLSLNRFLNVIHDKAVYLPSQTRAQLCKSVQIGRLFLQLTVKELARRHITITISRFLESSQGLFMRFDLRDDAAIRLLLIDEVRNLENQFQSRHTALAGMSEFFVWPDILIDEVSPRSRKLSV